MDHPAASDGSVPASADVIPALNLVVVFEDLAAQERAASLWNRVTRLVGPAAVHMNSWSIGELSDPAVLHAATLEAICADIIVVAVRATAEVPKPLCAWIEDWLAQRPRREGTLIAVVGVIPQPAAPSDRSQEFLRSTARRAGMDFLLQEYRIAPAPGRSIL